MDSDPLLSRRELAGRLSISRRELDRLLRNREFPAPVQVSARRIAWRSSEVALWEAEGVSVADRIRRITDRAVGDGSGRNARTRRSAMVKASGSRIAASGVRRGPSFLGFSDGKAEE